MMGFCFCRFSQPSHTYLRPIFLAGKLIYIYYNKNHRRLKMYNFEKCLKGKIESTVYRIIHDYFLGIQYNDI